MTDFLIKLFSEHGMSVLTWVLVALGALGGKYLWGRIKHEWARGVLERAYDEVKAAVLEVAQVYVDAIKAASADGKLTDDEKAEAKKRAIDTAKSNLGTKGLKRLARVLGLSSLESWLSNKTEAAVKSLKTSDPTSA